MDPKELELIEARAEFKRKWIEVTRKCRETFLINWDNAKRDDWDKADRKWIEAKRKWDEADCKLWKYQNRRITMTENGTPMNETASKQTPRTTTLDVFKLALGWMDGSMEDAKRRFAVASLQEQDRICRVMAASSSRIIDPLNAQYFMDKRDEHFGLLSRA